MGGTRVWMYFCQKSGHVRIPEANLDALATDAIVAYLARPDIYTLFAKPADGPELARVRGDRQGPIRSGWASRRSDQAR